MKRSTMLVLCVLACALCAGSVWAQEPADTLKVDYFANAHTGGAQDGTVRIDDPGTYTGGPLCAAIYVFDAFQEMSECCSCLETPDGLRTLSVNNDLTSNPLNGVTLTGGFLKIVSTLPYYTPQGVPFCPLPYGLSPTPALRAWATHIQNSNFTVTEGASQDATFSVPEKNALTKGCASISTVGSGAGVCSCGTGD